MKESELINLVRRLGHDIREIPSKLPANKISEEWTKQHLIDPLLKVLGWDSPYEVLLEDSSIHQDFMDYTLRPSSSKASSLCVEAKHLLAQPPRDRSHEQIKKGLEQTKIRGSDYFVWTNGNTWQLLAVKLPTAPIYEINIGQAAGDENEIQLTADRLRLLSRETAVNGPQAIVDQITVYWKEKALPEAFAALSGGLAEETIKLIRGVLPPELEISNEEILFFLKECRWKGTDIRQRSTSEKRRRFRPCPSEWERLVTSNEPMYERARKTLLADPRRKLGEFLISNNYKPWPRTITFSLLELPKRGSETKTVTGPAVGRYMEYGLIKIVDPQARPDEITYERVDEAMPYLRRILQSG